MTIKEMIKIAFDSLCKTLWLREIGKEEDLSDKHYRKYRHHLDVSVKMWEKYNEIYGEHKREEQT